jgi:hypothetical protein
MKYKGLGRQYMPNDIKPIKSEDLLYLKDVGQDCNVVVKIGAV